MKIFLLLMVLMATTALQGHSLTKKFQLTKEFLSLNVQLISEDIEIKANAADTELIVHVEVKPEEPGIYDKFLTGYLVFDPESSQLKVTRADDGDVEVKKIQILIPKSVKLEVVVLSSVSGDVAIKRVGLKESLALNTVSGNVIIKHVQGKSLKINTVSGDIGIKDSQFDGGMFNTVSGDIKATKVAFKTRPTWNTVSGDLDADSDIFGEQNNIGRRESHHNSRRGNWWKKRNRAGLTGFGFIYGQIPNRIEDQDLFSFEWFSMLEDSRVLYTSGFVYIGDMEYYDAVSIGKAIGIYLGNRHIGWNIGVSSHMGVGKLKYSDRSNFIVTLEVLTGLKMPLPLFALKADIAYVLPLSFGNFGTIENRFPLIKLGIIF